MVTTMPRQTKKREVSKDEFDAHIAAAAERSPLIRKSNGLHCEALRFGAVKMPSTWLKPIALERDGKFFILDEVPA